jgi:DNA-binding response OmpR family regulator
MEAVALFRDNPFDLVITDWAMPEMNGSQLAKMIKDISPKTPVILMTGLDSASANEIGPEQESADLILRKPLTRQKLRTALIEVLNGVRTDAPASDNATDIPAANG